MSEPAIATRRSVCSPRISLMLPHVQKRPWRGWPMGRGSWTPLVPNHLKCESSGHMGVLVPSFRHSPRASRHLATASFSLGLSGKRDVTSRGLSG
jgi:hypothetical protein